MSWSQVQPLVSFAKPKYSSLLEINSCNNLSTPKSSRALENTKPFSTCKTRNIAKNRSITRHVIGFEGAKRFYTRKEIRQRGLQ